MSPRKKSFFKGISEFLNQKWFGYLIGGIFMLSGPLLFSGESYQQRIVDMRTGQYGKKELTYIILHVLDEKIGKSGVYSIFLIASCAFFYLAYKEYHEKVRRKKK